MLKLIGYWITGLFDDDFPAPQELVGKMPDDDRRQLIDYLSNGASHAHCMGVSWCRFGCGVQHLGHRELTDGEWVWPEGLAHYVERHAVLLPEDFFDHARSRGKPAVTGPTSRHLDSHLRSKDPPAPVSNLFWQSWTAARRSPAALDRLQRGRRAAAALANDDSLKHRAKRVKSTLQHHGRGNTTCIWKGCKNPSLGSKLICVEHFLGAVERDPLGRFRSEFIAVLTELSDVHGIRADFGALRGKKKSLLANIIEKWRH